MDTGSLTCRGGWTRLSSQKKGFSIGLNLIKSSPPVAYWGAVELKSSPSHTPNTRVDHRRWHARLGNKECDTGWQALHFIAEPWMARKNMKGVNFPKRYCQVYKIMNNSLSLAAGLLVAKIIAEGIAPFTVHIILNWWFK